MSQNQKAARSLTTTVSLFVFAYLVPYDITNINVMRTRLLMRNSFIVGGIAIEGGYSTPFLVISSDCPSALTYIHN